MEKEVAARCASSAVASGRGGDWGAALGALQLGKLLGLALTAAAPDEARRAALLDVRSAAAAAKGPQARLLVGQIDELSAAGR